MGLFSFIGDALNDILGGNSSRKDSQKYNLQNMEIQQGYNLQNMELQNQYNIEAFNRENEYNSPVAQQERLRNAGLNVNWTDAGTAIAQQDSGVSSSSPSGGMPSGSNAGSLGDLISIASTVKQLKNIDADTKKKKAEEKNIRSQTIGQDIQNELDKIFGHDERYQGIRKTISEVDLNRQLEGKTKKEKEQVFGLAHAMISSLMADVELKDASREEINMRKKVLEDTLPKVIAFYDAQIEELGTRAKKQTVEANYIPYQSETDRMNAISNAKSAEASAIIARSTAFLNSAKARNLDADSIGRYISNAVEASLYEDGVQEAERRFAMNKVEAELDLARQTYRRLKPEEDFSTWLVRELNKSNGSALKQTMFLRRWFQNGVK